MSADAKSVLARLAAYQAAVHAKDIDAFAALYDADVRVFDMWGAWSCEGIAAWRAMAADWFGSLGTDAVVVGVDDARVQVEQNLASAQAFLTFTGVSASGETLRTMDNRLTWVLQRRGDAWKVVHEHTSAPMDFATSKLMQKRESR
ncbi:MAG: nuclear transport factor 2 family protein [Dokdonella sp.]